MRDAHPKRGHGLLRCGLFALALLGMATGAMRMQRIALAYEVESLIERREDLSAELRWKEAILAAETAPTRLLESLEALDGDAPAPLEARLSRRAAEVIFARDGSAAEGPTR